MEELRCQLEANAEYHRLRQAIKMSPAKHPDFTLVQNLILWKGRLWLPKGLTTPTGSHMGTAKTTNRLLENFEWSGLRQDVTNFVSQCLDCQHVKYETKRVVGLLCPLPIPHRPWEALSRDFITGLPPFRGNTIILVVVDKFSKGIHLGMLLTAHTAHAVASLLMKIVGKLHGLPYSLVSDRDPCLCKFWQELFFRSGMQLRMSSAYHPQSDSQTKVLNRVIEQCLRAFVHGRPQEWGKFLL